MEMQFILKRRFDDASFGEVLTIKLIEELKRMKAVFMELCKRRNDKGS
jgi:hypothetical protein